ncbi:homoserine kinase [Thalassoporum mexicanum PCC 7367]|uniref:homoserine kinase n=1 Tax=Thalassoporum mexicanum TaxID=3457544 RepID=UPI00029FF297|nr:homoserine kinase [Pseudanabaena sp. PCC 7367]AFY70475.1 homoserine kinase [Pseudanabaena sp. PCC 7367]
MSSYTVAIPATTGNLGPGFDCLGAALSLYNVFEFAIAPELKLTASGPYADKVAKNKNNLIYQSFERVFEQIQQPKPIISLHMDVQVPLARGLGSSATAIVGGMIGANLLAGSPLSDQEVLQLAIEMEGHPDNVAPAMLGGCQLVASGSDGGWEMCAIDWHQDLAVAVAIPDMELSTVKARQVLPKEVPMKDAVFNASHLALLTQALVNANPSWLSSALQDKLHQPYRQNLIPHMETVQKAAIAAGAYGVVISGAGPTLLALGNPAKIELIMSAMCDTWQGSGVNAIGKCLAIANDGAKVKSS